MTQADTTAPVSITLGGAPFPDWAAVTSETVRRGLEGIFERQDTARRWGNLDADEDRVRRAVLRHYLAAGVAPSVDELATATDFAPGVTADVVGRLARRDIVTLDHAGQAIAGAYPFTNRGSGHRVRIGATTVNAMCAIDALGISRHVRPGRDH